MACRSLSVKARGALRNFEAVGKYFSGSDYYGMKIKYAFYLSYKGKIWYNYDT